MENCSADEFLVNFDVLLDKSQWDDALNLILDPVNEQLIFLSCIDLVSCLGRRLSKSQFFMEDPEGWCTLQNILDYVVKISKPKETLIGLLELLEKIQTDEFFNSLLKPLKITFLRLRAKQPDSLAWAFDRLYSYIAKIDLSYDEELQHRYIESSSEKLLFENWPSEIRVRIDGLVESLLNFAEPFVSEVKQCKLIESVEQRNAQAMALVSVLMKLLEYPVSHFDVGSIAQKMKSDRVLLVQRLVAMLFDITPNIFWKLFDWVSRNKLTLGGQTFDDGREAAIWLVTPTSLGVLCAFVYPRQICLDQLPCVYSLEFIVDSLLPYAAALLLDESCSSENYRKLALKLCKFFFKLFKNTQIPSYKLETPFHYRLLAMGLLKAVSSSYSPKLRQKSFERFIDFLRSFDSAGQLMLIRWIFRFVVPEDDYEDGDEETVDRKPNAGEMIVPISACSGIRGHAIDLFRSLLRAELEAQKSIDAAKKIADQSESSHRFKICLPEMFGLFTTLKDGPETNLLCHFEQITAALNLLRYVCIAGSEIGGNLLVLHKDWLQSVESGFLATLAKAVDMTSAHYEMDPRKNCDEEGSAARGSNFDIENCTLKKELCNLDLMQFLLGRLNELVRSSIAERS